MIIVQVRMKTQPLFVQPLSFHGVGTHKVKSGISGNMVKVEKIVNLFPLTGCGGL
jgi:hypothetical protein